MKSLLQHCQLFSFFIVIGVITSCTKDFEKLNTDPVKVTSVAPGSLLAPAQFDGMWLITKRAHRLSNELMQYTVETGALNDFARYEFKENEFDAIWSTLYVKANDMNEMYKIAEKLNDVNNMGAALVMKAWFVSNLTDMFGDIPYTDAFKGREEVYYPKYDTQQSIYTNLLADLKRANTLFTENKPFDSSDLIYGSDPVKWKKFANSMRLRLLMRVSKRTEMNVPTEIAEMVADPVKFPLFTSNADEAMMRYDGIKPFINLFFEMSASEFSGSRRMGKSLMDLMNTTVDGRRFRYATKNTPGAYVGIPSGYTEQETQAFADNTGLKTSTLATTLKADDYPFPILTWAEVNFLLAEAALNGWISANAQTYFNKGVEASWRQWNCTWDPSGSTTPGATYLARPTVRFTGTTATLERIMSQKYIAMFFCGFESWYDYRRTGYPVLPVGPAAKNNGILPTRFEYPLITKATNKANYEAAAARIGGDNLRTKVWWQQ
ncbi:SusD/RagB family nutrient-binding outer membrane lipoprotein [Pedobacter hiemivivus]|uniref:SusD/RagB family nutrient-binding outer membrane lipoprotein n=1 Tax=Pedobacter hiemivivus TaxID=2530454 RepID=A0A4R0MH45_9SPHI|nr:SusD/RagB family nutrient-binding outer membrane lipoprotein [Pedobacter hiemivivus]TCC85860.1 SusD/RagB family nutrient-binding outer membrane lipoprotein [Pedobacter hiemivivus]